VNSEDPRVKDADIYIREATRMLEALLTNRKMDHSDFATVRAALEGLDIIERSIGTSKRPSGSTIAARLRQVADALSMIGKSSLALACSDLKSAAALYEATAAF